MNLNPHQILRDQYAEPPLPPPTIPQIKKAAAWFGMDTCNDAKVEALISGAFQWLECVRLNRRPRWLVMLGRSGVGKTMIASRIWKAMESNNKVDSAECEFVPRPIYWPEFVKKLRTGDAMERSLDMVKWPFLVLDDICAERDSTGFASDQLNTLLGRRDGKWTVITSNKFLDQLAEMELRIADRMQRDGSIVVETTATSFTQR